MIAFSIIPEALNSDEQTVKKTSHSERRVTHTLSNTILPRTATTFTPKDFVTGYLDHAPLLREAKRLEKDKEIYRFAKAIEVNITPQNAGEWLRQGNRDIWKLKICSPGASSLNIGFKKYYMPNGGELEIHRPEANSPYRAFTHADNDEHGELWTPLLAGDQMIVRASVPVGMRDQLALQIAAINHGFRPLFSKNLLNAGRQKIGGDVTGICHVDAICRSGDSNINDPLGIILDFYQDQIRSVAACTLGGVDACSGALINNTDNNKKPYFLTADHCGINSSNAASVVCYFNFQNSTCRPRSSAASAAVGDGNLSQFSTGSILRASHDSSDFCLVELDDPIPASFDVHYAGWNRSNTVPTMAVCVHHPAVAEKRVSVDTDDLGQLGKYWVVNDWDYGTTEGGSSGSPLFDSDGRIVGQLYGGNAACGNDLEDTYGKLFNSWTGNNTESTRLSNWLDPSGSGVTTLDGLDHSPALLIDNAEVLESDSGTSNMILTVWLSQPSANDISVDFQISNVSAISGVDYIGSVGTVVFASGEVEKTITVPVVGDTLAEQDETFSILLSNAVGAVLRKAQATGKILTDDFAVPIISGLTSVEAVTNSTFSHQLTVANLPAVFSLTGGYPPGMTIDKHTGLVEWVPNTSGTYSYRVHAKNPSGSDFHTVSVNVTDGPSTLSAAELEGKGVGFRTYSALWDLETSITHDGTDALKSGSIGDNGLSEFSITVNGPGTINFWLRVSSEEDYDFCYFALNGDTVLARSGSTAWEQHSYNLKPGANSLCWTYTKDSSDTDGDDAAYLDEVTFSGYAGWTAIHGITTAGGFFMDAEGDGVANGLEYAIGISPLLFDSHMLPRPYMNNSQLLKLSFTKPSDVSGITYDAEVSDNLQNWNTTGRSILTNSSSLFDAIQIPATPETSMKYMRLKVTPSP